MNRKSLYHRYVNDFQNRLQYLCLIFLENFIFLLNLKCFMSLKYLMNLKILVNLVLFFAIYLSYFLCFD